MAEKGGDRGARHAELRAAPALRRGRGARGTLRPPLRSAAARSPRRRPAPLRPRRRGRAAAASVSVGGARAAAAAENGCHRRRRHAATAGGARPRSPAARALPRSAPGSPRGAQTLAGAGERGPRRGARGGGGAATCGGGGAGDSAGRVREVDPNRRPDPCPREVAAPGWEMLWAVDLGDRVPPCRDPGPHPHPTPPHLGVGAGPASPDGPTARGKLSNR